MVAKTTSGSGFDIRFLFYVCDLVKNAIKSASSPRHFLRYLGSKFKYLKVI